MSLRRVRRVSSSVALVGILIASPALAAGMAVHTGAIVSENTKRDTITIEEMGPWHGPATRPVRREFHLTPRTTVELAVRKNEPRGFQGPYVEHPLKAADLRPGDYATVTVEREGGKPIATKVEIVRPEDNAAVPAPTRVESHALKTIASAAR
jgi:hypothetical protein